MSCAKRYYTWERTWYSLGSEDKVDVVSLAELGKEESGRERKISMKWFGDHHRCVCSKGRYTPCTDLKAQSYLVESEGLAESGGVREEAGKSSCRTRG